METINIIVTDTPELIKITVTDYQEIIKTFVVEQSGTDFVTEAPIDGSTYGRRNKAWTNVDVVPQVNSDWNSTTGVSKILNKPNTITAQQSADITTNNDKVGITPTQASDITNNNSKVGITPTQASDITTNNSKVGITTTQANDILANNSKVGITPTQASDITTNNAKVGITPTQASNIVTNNSKVGITPTQASDIVTNNAKVGITPTQASDITSNNTKVSFPEAPNDNKQYARKDLGWEEVTASSGTVDGSGTTNFVAKWQDTDTLEDSIIYDNGTNVGIGTSSPTHKLEIRNGDAHFENASSSNTFLDVKGSSANGYIRVYSDSNSVWLYQGGSSSYLQSQSGSTLRLGSGTSNLVITDTSGEVIRTSAGNVGIGTTNPQEKIHIKGQARFENATTGNSGAFGIDSAGAYFGSYSNIPLRFIIQNGIKTPLYINTSGNVGIGTTTPSEKLHVKGGSGLIQSTSYSDSGFTVSDDIYDYRIGTTPPQVRGNFIAIRRSGSNTLFEQSQGDFIWKTASSEKMRIGSDGNVSIGTTNANNKLVVSGIDTNAELDGTTVTQAALQLSNSDVAYGTFFGTQSSGTGLIQQRRRATEVYYPLGINPYGGNVGIGTSNPSEKLEVDGNAKATSFIKDGGTSAEYLMADGSVTSGAGGGVTKIIAGTGVTISPVGGTGDVTINASGGGGGSFLPLSGGTMTGTNGVIFPDNFRLNLGTGSDLQLFVNSVGSSISNQTANLDISNNADDGQIVIRTDNGSGGAADYIRASGSTGAVILYHYGATKLATTSTGVSVTGNGIFTNRVGIGTTNPTSRGFSIEKTSADAGMSIIRKNADNSTLGSHEFYINGSGDTEIRNVSNKPINFYTNNLFAMRIAQSGNVGIGTTNPGYKFEVNSGNANNVAKFVSTDGGGTITVADSGGEVGFSNIGNNIYFKTSSSQTNQMSILNSGRVGIGTNSPSEKLHVFGGASAIKIDSTTNEASLKYDNSTTTAAIKLANNDLKTELGGSEKMRILANGNVGIGTTNPGAKLEVDGNVKIGDSATGAIFAKSGNDFLITGVDTVGNAFNSIHLKADSLDTGLYIQKDTNNVGIGTTTPTNKLDVSGGNIQINNGGATWLGSDSTGGFARTFNGNTFRFISSANAETMRINNATGNVGIGTTNPVTKLEVFGDTTIKNANGSNPADAGSLYFKESGTTWGTDFYGFRINNEGVTNSLRFQSANTTTIVDIISLSRDSGNVGIGTTSPSRKLDVAGDLGIASSVNALRIGGNGVLGVLNGLTRLSGTGGSSGGIMFTPNNDNTERMRIDFEGNVGIGTTSPTSKLQVNGGVQIGNDTDTASASKVGTQRYRADSNNSYVDMCMQTGATTYEWVNIVQNNW